ncbi:MAG TPA: hypothetical protein VLB82_04945 [Thermodesulfobacteriota bacterium]|nr:hypothetical protein [Thermodesulfobacteriota bacterium]
MEIKDLAESWKSILSFGIMIVGATVAVIVYANEVSEENVNEVREETKEQLYLMKAQSALIHNDYYQQGRIERKEIEIRENQRELNRLLDYIGDDEPTPRQHREIVYLDEEIARLREEIEEIRVELTTVNE